MAWADCYTPEFRAADTLGAAAGTTATNDRRLVEAGSNLSTFTFQSGAIDTGRYAMRVPSGAFATFNLATLLSAPRYVGMGFRFRVSALPNVNYQLAKITGSTAGQSLVLRVTTAGGVSYSFDNGSTFTASGTTLAASTTYAVEFFGDFGTTTNDHAIKVRLNGTEIVNATGGGTGTSTGTSSSPQFGTPTTATTNLDLSDMWVYNDTADYATAGPDWRVYGVEPTSDGAHSMTANDFQDASSNNLSNSTTTSWDWVNDAPGAAPSTSDFVKQVVLRATSYMEWVLNTATIPNTTGTPLLVCLAAAMHPVGAATANSVAFRLNSGGNLSTEAAIDTSVTADTLEYRKHMYASEPATAAAWTLAKVQSLRARFGYSGDATPPPALDWIMAFVVAPTSQPRRATIQPQPGAVYRAACW